MTLEDGVFNSFEGVEISGAERAKLFPTDIGILVNDFLVDNFSGIIDYNFTANIEKEFDEIAEGLKEWKEMFEEIGFTVKTRQIKDPQSSKKWKRELGTLFVIGTKP